MFNLMQDRIEAIKRKLLHDHPERFLGYRLSMKSQKQWAEYERKEKERKAVIRAAQHMIERAHVDYERGKVHLRDDIRKLAEWTLNWSPERVMSRHKHFKHLCEALKDETTWKMLSRKERRFIADAVSAGAVV